jgi:5'-3' exonuclease
MLLDTASLYFRAFHGVPDTVRSPDGASVNAVRGLLDMIAKLLNEFEPTHVVACWDDDWRPQWRVDMIPSYKAHRVARESDGGSVEEVPDLLEPQVAIIRELLAQLGIPVVGLPGYEADDVIGTLASRSRMPVDIVTGDRDLFQLVDDARNVRVIYTGRGMSNLELLTDAVVTKKYGVTPKQYVDYAVLRGDPSDGLPGVSGIGEKTALALVAEFGSLDGIIAAASDPDVTLGAAVRAKLTAAADYLTVATKVVEVVRDLDLGDHDGRITPITPERAEALDGLAETWGLGSSLTRARAAITARSESGQ